MSKIMILVFMLCFLMIDGTTTTQAYDAVVSNCAQFGGVNSLAQALDTVKTGGGTITFTCSGTIVIPTTIIITNAVTIIADGQITLDGGDEIQIFMVEYEGTLTLDGVRLQHGWGYEGGAIQNLGTSIIRNSTFFGNFSEVGGGAIFNFGILDVVNTQFIRNISLYGGAIYSVNEMHISHSRFVGNGGLYSGGAIEGGGESIIIASEFIHNMATGVSGGVASSGDIVIINSLFRHNIGKIYGGGFYSNGVARLYHNTFIGNISELGGGVIVMDHRATNRVSIAYSDFRYNLSVVEGGAIYSYGDTPLTVYKNAFRNNLTLQGTENHVYAGNLHDIDVQK